MTLPFGINHPLRIDRAQARVLGAEASSSPRLVQRGRGRPRPYLTEALPRIEGPGSLTRRRFLARAALALAGAGLVPHTVAAGSSGSPRTPGRALTFATPLTHCDWMLKDNRPEVVWKELLAYPLDGLFLDWLRTGDVRDNPQTDPQGVANYGYEQPLVDGFKRRFGVDPHTLPNNDPRWVRFRAGPSTQFMRQVRKLARVHRKRLPITVLVAHPWCYRGLGDKIDGNLNGLLLDVPAWGREALIDGACPAGYYRDGGSPEQAYRWLQTETGGRVDIWRYEWMPKKPEDFAARRAPGAEQSHGG